MTSVGNWLSSSKAIFEPFRSPLRGPTFPSCMIKAPVNLFVLLILRQPLSHIFRPASFLPSLLMEASFWGFVPISIGGAV